MEYSSKKRSMLNPERLEAIASIAEREGGFDRVCVSSMMRELNMRSKRQIYSYLSAARERIQK